MPPQAAFSEAYEYYATALHELGHGTGNGKRLARDFGPFGSEAYAKEELRAEMASYMIATETGLGHHPERHANYVESWLKALKDDHNMLFQAARDAEKIRSWIMEPEKRQALELAAQQVQKAEKKPFLQRATEKVGQLKEKFMGANSMEPESKDKDISPEKQQATALDHSSRIYLEVPLQDIEEVESRGAKFDQKNDKWFISRNEMPVSFVQWIPQIPGNMTIIRTITSWFP